MSWNREMLRLYAVTDRRWLRGQTLAQQVEAAIRGGASMIQLREKDMPFEEFLAEAKEIGEICRRYHVPLIINDNVEIALQSGADGVHVGQEDMPPHEIRRRAGRSLIVGVTAKTVDQALAAQAAGADYLGSGAVFGTATKTNARPMRRETLTAICSAVEIPVVAIGGINRDNISFLHSTGISGVAVVSGIFAAEDIEAECHALLKLARALSG